MNEYEIKLLTKHRDAYREIIKEQHRLPKSSRSNKLLEQTKVKLSTINRWLKDD